MNKELPLVSILITSYNREEFIRDSIESVLGSDYSNLEIIILDDASTDGTYQIAELYSKRDKRIKLYKNEINLGQFENRNKIAQLATGKYLKYLDSDDKLNKDSITILVNEISIAEGVDLIIGKKDLCKPRFIKSTRESYYDNYIKQSGYFGVAPLSWMVNRTFFIELGGFQNYFGEGDYCFLLEAALKTDILFIRLDVGFYREHVNQIDHLRRENKLIQFRYLNCDFKNIIKNISTIGYFLSLKILIKIIYSYLHVLKGTLFKKPMDTIRYIVNREYSNFR